MASVELMHLIEIGRLRSGQPLYMPDPELDILYREALANATARAWDSGQWDVAEIAVQECSRTLQKFVADQQRVYDAILTGAPRPFEDTPLRGFAGVLRFS